MKRWIIASLASAATFIIGMSLAWSPATQETAILTEPIPSILPEKLQALDNNDIMPEFRDLPDEIEYPDSTNSLIDVFENGDLYRESEVVAKSGETWLGLFDQNGRSSLIPTKATVNKLRTISYPGEEHDVRLKFDHSGVPIFAVRNIKNLKAGTVTTLYHRPSTDEIDRRKLPIGAMKTGYKYDFNLKESWYTLRVSTGLRNNGDKVVVLVLEHDKQSQVIASNYGDEIGNLFWVGDIDNDGKLDLYFDESNEKGYFGVGLYLSSQADPGKLVKRIATFGMAGC